MAYSAFDDKDLEPRDSDLTATLGDSWNLWGELESLVEEQFQPLSVDCELAMIFARLPE
jgi:hypothetical protein